MLPVLHIGFHKCGSTTLQAGLFARHPQIANLGEPREMPAALAAMQQAMLACHINPAKQAPINIEASRQLWQEAIASVDSRKVALFSKEALTLHDYYRKLGDSRLPELLRDVVGPARILIVIRNQSRLLESLYLFRTKGPKFETLEDWLRANRTAAVSAYFYCTMAEVYADVFGRENVGVFLLEDLQADAEKIARSLCQFIGVDAKLGADLLNDVHRNKRVSQRYRTYSKMRKRLGLFLPLGQVLPQSTRDAFNGFIRRGVDARIRLSDTWLKEIEQCYGEDNRKLAADWGLPLEKYGYPL